jgi:hypothetical protein
VVTSQSDAPADGSFAAEVAMREPGTLVLASSFDPRWVAVVDGVARPTVMVAPGTVGVSVDAGRHEVVFTYHPYPWYLLLFALVPVGVGGLALLERRLPRRTAPVER